MCWACNLLALMLSNDVNLSHISNGYYSIYVERKEINPFLLTCPILRHMNDMSNFNGIILVFDCVAWCHPQFQWNTVQGLPNQNNSSLLVMLNNFGAWCASLCVVTSKKVGRTFEKVANRCITNVLHDMWMEWHLEWKRKC